mgnify:FL=1
MSTKIEQLDLPLYRGRSVKTKQYVEGYLKTCTDTGANVYWIQTKEWIDYQIDPETLSISFVNMLGNKNTRIFASLSYSGKGGDCTFMENGYNETFCWDSLNGCIVLKSPNYEARLFKDKRTTHFKRYKIIGIQE